MRVFISILTCFIALYQTEALSAEKSKDKKIHQSLQAKNQGNMKIKTPDWTPVSFQLDADNLPINFTGLDFKEFMKMFDSKLKLLDKGEFETTEEHTKRIENIDGILHPISKNDKYAFNIPIQMHSFKYDADKQQYIYNSKYGYSCKPSNTKFVTCYVGALIDNSSKYVGSNAYGMEVIVSKTSGTDFSLAIDPENSLYKSLFTTKSEHDKGMIMTVGLPASVDKAKDIKDKNIAAIFIGNVSEAEKINGARVYYSATIDWPSAMDIETVAIPFNLERVIFYIQETGEILAQYPNLG